MENVKKRYESVKLLYMCLMAVYVAVREVTPLHIYISSTYVSAAVFLCGFALIVAGLFLSDGCFSDRRSDALCLFLAVTVLSCAVNFKYGYEDNIKALGAMALFFFLFFESGVKKTKERRSREIDCVTGTLSVVWAFLAFASILMFSFSILYKVYEGRWLLRVQGFSPELNRLCGVFQDPNYAGYVSATVIFAAVRFIKKTRRVFVKVINVISILLQLVFLTLAGSFSATTILLAAVFLFAFYAFGSRHGERRFGAYVKSAAVAALCCALCYGLIVGGQYVLPYTRAVNRLLPESVPVAVTKMYDELYAHSDLSVRVRKTAYGDEGSGETFDTEPIKRKDTEEYNSANDFSHGRFDRWKQTVQIFAGTPVFGTSPRNLSSYAKVHFPDTLMARYQMVPHNGYLDILVGTGVLGAVSFLLFFIPALIALLKKYFRFENDTDFLFSVVSVFIMAASAMFVSDLFFMISIGAFVFWTFMGYALHTEETLPEKKGVLRKLYEAVFRRKDRAA